MQKSKALLLLLTLSLCAPASSQPRTSASPYSNALVAGGVLTAAFGACYAGYLYGTRKATRRLQSQLQQELAARRTLILQKAAEYNSLAERKRREISKLEKQKIEFQKQLESEQQKFAMLQSRQQQTDRLIQSGLGDSLRGKRRLEQLEKENQQLRGYLCSFFALYGQRPLPPLPGAIEDNALVVLQQPDRQVPDELLRELKRLPSSEPTSPPAASIEELD